MIVSTTYHLGVIVLFYHSCYTSSMKTDDNRRVTVRGIVYHDGKLFCQQLKGADGQGRGFWCTPGGGLELNESLEEALQREMKEETGVDAHVGRLLFIQQYSEKVSSSPYGQIESLEFFFLIENPADFMHIDTTASHYDAEIFDSRFVDPKTERVLPKFLAKIDLADYTQNLKPVYFYTEFDQ